MGKGEHLLPPLRSFFLRRTPHRQRGPECHQQPRDLCTKANSYKALQEKELLPEPHRVSLHHEEFLCEEGRRGMSWKMARRKWSILASLPILFHLFVQQLCIKGPGIPPAQRWTLETHGEEETHRWSPHILQIPTKDQILNNCMHSVFAVRPLKLSYSLGSSPAHCVRELFPGELTQTKS